MSSCGLCGGESSPFQGTSCFQCDQCGLVYLPEREHPTRKTEIERYQLHENSLSDSRYLDWLSEAVEALRPYIKTGQRGLDYGSGSVAAMAHLLKGFSVATYDPIFFPDQGVFREQFDFVIAHEVVEHFRAPGEEWARMSTLLRPGGVLLVRTEMLTSETDFSNWHYRRDPTHLCFYGKTTMDWIGRRFGWQVLYRVGCVTVFRS